MADNLGAISWKQEDEVTRWGSLLIGELGW